MTAPQRGTATSQIKQERVRRASQAKTACAQAQSLKEKSLCLGWRWGTEGRNGDRLVPHHMASVCAKAFEMKLMEIYIIPLILRCLWWPC
jgi:hypothetical protein